MSLTQELTPSAPTNSPTIQNEETTGRALSDRANEDAGRSNTQSSDRECAVKRAQQVIATVQTGSLDHQMQAINDAISILYPFSPRPAQQEALHHLIFRRKDLILIAKTSFGKSLILQAVSVLLRKSTSIIMLPLDQIGHEQAAYISRIGGKPCFLNRDTINDKLLKEVESGCFTHVLLSPEIAVGDDFQQIAATPEFKSRVSMVVVDEAHLVKQWGTKFRPAYAQLNVLRSLLGSAIPWFACSATLHRSTLNDLKQNISFQSNVKIQRTSIDRPEILVRLGWIPKRTKQQFTALRFLFCHPQPSESPLLSPGDIPKTIVFLDSRTDTHKAYQACCDWLANAAPRYNNRTIHDAVKVYHSNTAQFDKDSILAEFQKPGMESSIRVVLATEALGLGVNLPDVRRVVLYGLPISVDPAVFWQRSGRASRDNLPGESIMLMDPWVKGERGVVSEHQQKYGRKKPANSGEKGSSTKKTDKERRDTLPEFWYNMGNSDRCLRHEVLDYFDEPIEFRTAIDSDRCCNNCNKEYGIRNLDDFYLYREKGSGETAVTRELKSRLMEWAASQLDSVFTDVLYDPIPEHFIDSEQSDRLARAAFSIKSSEEMNSVMGSWYFFETHGEALFQKLRAEYSNLVGTTSTLQPAIPVSQSSGAPNQISWPLPIPSVSVPEPEDSTLPSSQPSSNKSRKRQPLEPISGNVPSKRKRSGVSKR